MEYYLLFAIGLILIALEVFIYSFVVIWFGLGFFIVGFFSLFFSFNELNYQLITICIISILLLFLFRNSLKKRFFRASKNIPDNFLNSSGVGEFKQGKIFYKGTFWELDPNFDITKLKENQKIKVLKVEQNIAFVDNTEVNKG